MGSIHGRSVYVQPARRWVLHRAQVPFQGEAPSWCRDLTAAPFRTCSVCLLSRFGCVRLFATLWTAVHQAALPRGFSRQEDCGVGCLALLQGILPTQGSNQCLLCLLHWQADSYSLVPLGKSLCLASCLLTPLNYSLSPKWKFWLSTILSFQHPRILYCIFSNAFMW